MPITRGLLYALTYFLIFTLLVVLLREPLTASGVPNHYLPVILSMIMTVFFVPTALYLTIIRPNEPFAFDKKSRRWMRFFVYVGLFMLFAVLFPFFPANKGSNLSWLAGLMPLLMLICMVNPLKVQVRLAVIPKSRDSRWRSVKYGVAYTLLLTPPAAILCWLFLTHRLLSDELLAGSILISGAYCYLLYFFMMHRLIVIKPHSRFDAMNSSSRYKRLAAYCVTYVFIGFLGPWIMTTYWQWNIGLNYSLILALALFNCAAFGTDAAPANSRWPASEPPSPQKEPQVKRSGED